MAGEGKWKRRTGRTLVILQFVDFVAFACLLFHHLTIHVTDNDGTLGHYGLPTKVVIRD